jgi:catechol 2,3-dioxygenase-like lactoylglutathione lyase family enzyme
MTVIPAVPGSLEMYHTGLVVPDVRAAAEHYTSLLGLQFATFRESTMTVLRDGVQQQADLLVTYTITGPPYLELIEERSGSVWATDALGLNHVGFYAPDLREARARLDAEGFPARVVDVGGDGSPDRFTYHQVEGGLWVELVATTFKAQLADWIERSLALTPSHSAG